MLNFAAWIATEDELTYYVCSCCHWGFYYHKGEQPDICPNCASKMAETRSIKDYDIYTKTTRLDGTMEDKQTPPN